MPSITITLYDPFLGIVSGSGDASLTLTDADDGFFEVPDQTGSNQTALLDGSPVTIKSIEQAIGPQLIVALVGGVQVNLDLTPIRITVENGLFDDGYIYFPGLPDGAEILVGLSVPLVFPNDIDIPLCLASDTMIRTPDGLRAIGDLMVGDTVETMDHGSVEILWVGKSTIDFAERPDMRRHRPVLIKKGAFGDTIPINDVVLSPQHSVLFSGPQTEIHIGEEESLAPAKSLINGRSIIHMADCEKIEYCHLLLHRHEIVWAEGLPVESLFLGDLARNQIDGAAKAEILDVFPDIRIDGAIGHQRVRPRLKSFEAAMLMSLLAA